MKLSDRLIKFIGNSSAFAFDKTNTSGYICINNQFVLIDCGENIMSKLTSLEDLKSSTKIDILITHLHGDHAGSLSTFIFYCYYVKNITPVVHITFPELLNYLKITGCKRCCDVNTSYLYTKSKSVDYRVNDYIQIEPIKTQHCEDITSIGYLIKTGVYNLYYSGDSFDIPDKILNDFKMGNIDYIYQDICSLEYPNNPHMYIEKLFEIIPENLRERVYTMHYDNDGVETLAMLNKFKISKLI